MGFDGKRNKRYIECIYILMDWETGKNNGDTKIQG